MPPAPDLPHARFADTLRILALAAGPQLAKGMILRRPFVVGLLARSGAEAAGTRLLARLRTRYGRGPLLFRAGTRRFALVLDPADMALVLEGTPCPFDPATPEKRAALAHFQPRGSLISAPEDRSARRGFSERVLESGCPIHCLAARFAEAADEEAAALTDGADTLAWPGFRRRWYRLVRTVVFGRAAANDEAVTAMLDRLRGDANWAFLKPRRERLRELFLASIQARLKRADGASLGGLVAEGDFGQAAAPDQVAQWLFAFDAAGMATFRALAILALDPAAMARARTEAETGATDLPFLRAAIEETVRLWPTTPLVLREARQDVALPAGCIRSGTGILIHLPYFHRDSTRLPFADRFTPDIWLDGTAASHGLAPFSGGPGLCPGRDLVLLLGSLALAALLRRRAFSVPPSRRLDPRHLPPAFDHFSLALAVSPHPAEPPAERAG